MAPLKHLADTISKISFSPNKHCDIGHLAKETRLPFSSSSISTTTPFELIHCDIWGPYKIASHSSAHYFFTIVDDFTHYTWIYLMRFKSKTQSLLKKKFSMVET